MLPVYCQSRIVLLQFKSLTHACAILYLLLCSPALIIWWYQFSAAAVLSALLLLRIHAILHCNLSAACLPLRWSALPSCGSCYGLIRTSALVVHPAPFFTPALVVHGQCVPYLCMCYSCWSRDALVVYIPLGRLIVFTPARVEEADHTQFKCNRHGISSPLLCFLAFRASPGPTS